LGGRKKPKFPKSTKKKKTFADVKEKNKEAPLGGKGALQLKKTLAKIDEAYGAEIAEDSENFLFERKDGKEVSIGDLTYVPLINISETPNEPKEDWRPWNRMKVAIPTKGDPKEPDLEVCVAVHDDETGKVDQQMVTSLDDLAELFRIGCTAQFILKFERFYVLKSSMEARFKVTCEMINITKKAQTSSHSKPSKNWNLYIGKSAQNSEKSDDDDDASPRKANSDVDDDDEDVKPTKKQAKKPASDSDDDDSDVKPTTKKSSKKRVVTDSDDDSDEETKKPAKKGSSTKSGKNKKR